jgi:hypothetical protein
MARKVKMSNARDRFEMGRGGQTRPTTRVKEQSFFTSTHHPTFYILCLTGCTEPKLIVIYIYTYIILILIYNKLIYFNIYEYIIHNNNVLYVI